MTPTVSAASDTTPPILDVPRYPSFVLGQQISIDGRGGVQERLTWAASDDVQGSGLRDVRAFEEYGEGGTDNIRLLYAGLASSLTVLGVPNSRYTCSGYLQRRFVLKARDWAGNVSKAQSLGVPVVVDDDGTDMAFYVDDTIVQSMTVQRTGAWGVSTFSGWIGGTTQRTYEVGASISYTRSYARGQHVALVMPKGTDRGKAQILVDGDPRAVGDTHASTATHRVLVFETRMPKGEHTLTVKNLGTPGYGRIDVDALLYNQYGDQCSGRS